MLKQSIFLAAVLAILALTSQKFAEKKVSWVATLKLDAISKPIILTSDAIYGGYDPYSKKFYFLGKNHMFQSKTDPESAKIFNDLCITNASGQFQFELNEVPEIVNKSVSINKEFSGNFLFTKKFPIKGKISQTNGQNLNISISGNLENLGLKFTPEATKLFKGNFSLVIENKQ